ncbi:MAG: hypothetical protein WBV96_17965 [Polyangia bacterium]
MSLPFLSDAEARRRARASWRIAVLPLAADTDDDLSGETTPAQRIAMMWPLAVEAWRLAGRPLPTYSRADLPSRVFRDAPPDDDEPR